MRRLAALGSALLLTTALAGCGDSGAGEEGAEVAAAPVCDRACLIDLASTYVSGLESNSAEGITFADGVRIVENIKPIAAGEGLWADITGPGTDFSVVVPDEINQTVGWIGQVERDGEPTVVAVRIKLDGNGDISEAEHLYSSLRPDVAANLETPRAGLVTDVPEGSRMDHDELIRIAASYYDALDDNDGTLTPFAEDCERRENGMVAAAPDAGPGPGAPTEHPVARDCEGQLTSNTMAYITSIDNRRVFAADPVTGLVMGLSHFRHPMDFEPYEVTAIDGTKVMRTKDDMFSELGPFDLPAAHVFKIGADGKVHEIEAMGFITDYNAPTGWDEG